MAKLFLTSSKVSPEFVYKEYVSHFNWLSSRSHTECWIASDYPELFTSKNIIPLANTREAKKTLASLLGIPVKHVTSQILPRQAISPDEKLLIPFELSPRNPIVVPKASKLLKLLDTLKTATKIVTWQEIFVYFAVVHKIPCLAFYDEWNANQYKGANVKLLPASVNDKTKLIDDFLVSASV